MVGIAEGGFEMQTLQALITVLSYNKEAGSPLQIHPADPVVKPQGGTQKVIGISEGGFEMQTL